MALGRCGLNLDRTQRELQPHGDPAFPCAGYEAFYPAGRLPGIPWHWHEELELMLVVEGGLEVQLPRQSFSLGPGDCLALNAGLLHCGTAAGEGCLLRSLVFHPLLVAGGRESVFFTRYLQPLLDAPGFWGVCWPAGSQQAGWFAAAFAALSEEPEGFEFAVRGALSRLCLSLFVQFGGQAAGAGRAKGADQQRAKQMLEFLQQRYAEPLTLAQIAAAASVSPRECLRCFQRTLHCPPMQYLMRYRLQRAAARLLAAPDEGIGQLAAACGFDSPSNFARLFRRYYLCTPRDYRKRHAAAGQGAGAPGDGAGPV